MPTVWRQGDLLAPDSAVALGVIETTQRDTHRVLVVSHSCDIASDDDIEPTVEILIGVVVQQAAANCQNGHAIRTLHLGAEGYPCAEWVQYGIAQRRTVSKAALLQHAPWAERRYTGDQRALLRRWLAQRYARCEFPDAFINWLRESGVGGKFEDIGKQNSAHLVGIYFDFDDDSEREDPSNPHARHQSRLRRGKRRSFRRRRASRKATRRSVRPAMQVEWRMALDRTDILRRSL